MGMFDTIVFDQPIPCPKCGADIRSDQIKAFENTLDVYHTGDCIAHAEEIRIVRDELYCAKCRSFTGEHYYLVVYRGILVGIELTREPAEALLRSFSFEKLLLWYHDLYRARERAKANTRRAVGFMRDVCEWFDRGYDQMTPDERPALLFIRYRNILESSDTPLAALQRFVAERKPEDGDEVEFWL